MGHQLNQQRREGGAAVGYLLKMHPFLKHRILSKNMLDLLGQRKGGVKRAKRGPYDLGTRSQLQPQFAGQVPQMTPGASLRGAVTPPNNNLANLGYIGVARTNGPGEYSGGTMVRNLTQPQCSNSTIQMDDVIKEIEQMKYGNPIDEEGECRINGSWTAEVAGRHIDILDKTVGCRYLAKLRRPLQKHRRGILGCDRWNATVLVPFKNKQNYIILTAFNYKRNIVATFMGECRVCRSKAMVQGQWFIAHHSRDCEGLGSTHMVVGDVWRRNKMREVQEHRLEKLRQKNGQGLTAPPKEALTFAVVNKKEAIFSSTTPSFKSTGTTAGHKWRWRKKVTPPTS